jgi:hypothetical protein
MADYYIDANRGLDTNPGTLLLPWKTLGKINSDLASLGPGDSLNLANDSHWILNSSPADNLTCNGWVGTEEYPILIRGYEAGGGSGAYPIIESWYEPKTAEWTWDAVNGAWYYTNGSAFYGAFALVMLGDPLVYGVGQDPTKDINTLVADGDYIFPSADTTKFYLYAPAGIDPTTYYGKVRVSSGSRGVFKIMGNNWNHLHFSDLKFQYSGACINPLQGVGGDVRVLRATNIHGYHACGLVSASAESGSVFDIVAEGLHADTSPCLFVWGNAKGGLGRYSRFEVKNSTFLRSGQAYPQGAVYLSMDGAYIHDNEFGYCGGSNKFKLWDGCGAYTEISSANTRVMRNYFHHSQRAMQDNSAASQEFVGNIIDTCGVGMQVTGVTTGHVYCNNTHVNVGLTDYRGPTVYEAEAAWTEVVTGGVFRVDNNIVVGATGAASAFRTNATGFKNNCVSGVAVTGLTGDSGTISANPLLNSNYVPAISSPCINGGVRVPAHYVDYNGHRFAGMPTIGAIEPKRTAHLRRVQA